MFIARRELLSSCKLQPCPSRHDTTRHDLRMKSNKEGDEHPRYALVRVKGRDLCVGQWWTRFYISSDTREEREKRASKKAGMNGQLNHHKQDNERCAGGLDGMDACSSPYLSSFPSLARITRMHAYFTKNDTHNRHRVGFSPFFRECGSLSVSLSLSLSLSLCLRWFIRLAMPE